MIDPLVIQKNADLLPTKRSGTPESGWYLTTRHGYPAHEYSIRQIEYYSSENGGWLFQHACTLPTSWARIRVLKGESDGNQTH